MEKKLSKKALSKSFHNWYWGHLTCFSQEHMQTFGYLHAMLPLCEELYENEDDKAKAMNTYTAFFNTEPAAWFCDRRNDGRTRGIQGQRR